MKKNEIKTNKVGKIEEMINNCYKDFDGTDFCVGNTITKTCGLLLDNKYKIYVTRSNGGFFDEYEKQHPLWTVAIREVADDSWYNVKVVLDLANINRIDGKYYKWSKKVVENAAKIIVNAIDKYEGKIDENLNGFTCQEQYDAVYDAISEAAIVDFTAPDDIKIRTEYDYITVNIDGLEFDIDLSDETIKNITCDYPMTMFDIRRIKSVNDSIIDIYEAGRKWIKEELEVNA